MLALPGQLLDHMTAAPFDKTHVTRNAPHTGMGSKEIKGAGVIKCQLPLVQQVLGTLLGPAVLGAAPNALSRLRY